MKITRSIKLLSLLFVILSSSSVILFSIKATPAQSAQNYHYLRADNDCVNKQCDGSSWDLAWNDLPVYWQYYKSFKRGYTYFYADGNYSGFQMRTESVTGDASQYVTLKKAIDNTRCAQIGKTPEECHGSSVGWSDSYGDGTSIFNSMLSFTFDKFIFDGQVGGGPKSWDSGFGFKIVIPCDLSLGNNFAGIATQDADDINISHVDINMGNEGSDTGLYWWSNAISLTTGNDISVSYCYLHDVTTTMITVHDVSNSLVENNFFDKRYGGEYKAGAGIHGEGISWHGVTTPSNNVIRNNYFKDIKGTGVVVLMETNTGFKIHNNLFYTSNKSKYGVGNGTIVSTSASIINDVSTYNNTIVNASCPGTSCGISWSCTTSNCTNWYTYNNVFFNTDHVSLNGVHDYNLLVNSPYGYGTIASAHEIVSTIDPFVSSATGDFHLKAGALTIDAGTPLSSEYAQDLDGVARPQGAGWDIGAYEYISGTADTTPPSAPTGLSVN